MINYYQLVKKAKNQSYKEKKAIVDKFIEEVEGLYQQIDALFDLFNEEKVILKPIDGVTDEELDFFYQENLKNVDKDELKKRLDRMSEKVTEHNKNNDDDNQRFDIFGLEEKFSVEDFISYHDEGAFHDHYVEFGYNDLREDRDQYRYFLKESHYFRK
jgi:hypothetical protein